MCSILVVRLERYSACEKDLCYYEVTSDGTILYKGFSKGLPVEHSTIMTRDEITRLSDLIQQTYFSNLNDRYISDNFKAGSLPCYTISIKDGDEFNKITFDEGRETPLGLNIMRHLIESKPKSMHWID